jgi:peptidoglycan/LPS O-acetylase OafA/YrhL
VKKQKIYFPNLNGLRFIAAFLVIIHHLEQLKSISKIENYWDAIPFIGIIGKLGVILFFVLSGFLITYLLLAEENSFKKISIKEFYMRRILRIWPLYFLIITLAFVVLPNIELFTLPGYSKDVIYSNLAWKLILYAIFFPNLVLSLLGTVPYASHTWSIGTEEQFYLVWPVILKYIKKHRILLMVGIIISYLAIKFFLLTSFGNYIPYSNVIRAFWNSFPIDCMAIGGLYSILLFQKSKYLKYIIRNDLFYFSICLMTLFMIKGIYIPYIHYEFYSVFFGLIIINFAVNKKIKISLENTILNYLGNISYGIYMYHPIGIVLTLYISLSFDIHTNWLIYPLSLILTITMAGLSYKYFESFFLKFKVRFSKILSGNATNE